MRDFFTDFDHIYSGMVGEWIVKYVRDIVFKGQLSLVDQLLYNVFQSVATFYVMT